MRILVADDDRILRRLVETNLERNGHEVLDVADGAAAWEALQREDAPELAIVDWMMPGLDGVELCRRARALSPARPLYILLLTARSGSADVARALDAGADDYMTKPFDPIELRARVGVGVRFVELQHELAGQIAELKKALARVDELHGILPVCSYCKKVRSDADSWHQMESYISAHSSVRFSHGICPACEDGVVKAEIEEWQRRDAC